MAEDGKTGFTRRDLVRGTLVGAIATGVKAKPPAEDLPLGPGPEPLTLKINGAVHRLSLEPRVMLVDALRERIGLTGTKVVCGRGACGACTVLVDGETSCSCLLLAHDVAGKDITTIEGLAANGELTPLQKAFVEADALQCGFCTSGMVMSCHQLLASNPRPTRPEIRAAVAGNLCRCGTYNHVFEAVERAAGLKTAEYGRGETVNVPGPLVSYLPFAVSRLGDDLRVAAATAEAMEEEA
ncbi:MAG TPA: (2Fe-2S)-binding protein [Thermoanaerobaculia bacterium]|jgi:aerobic-type carbon monoxide dehydrogenase small subunit (CoxS/CutS family)